MFFLIDFEASFIRLLDKLTNGSRIEVNETGTVRLVPVHYGFLKINILSDVCVKWGPFWEGNEIAIS